MRRLGAVTAVMLLLGGMQAIGSTDTLALKVPVTAPVALAVNPVTGKVFVAGSPMTVIDGATNGSAPIPTVTGRFVAINPKTNKVYAIRAHGNAGVSVIDGATNTIVDVQAGSGPSNELAVNTVTNKIYVAGQYDDNVTVIDGLTNATTVVPDTSPGGHTDPNALAVNEVTNKIYVLNNDPAAPGITVIDGATNATTQLAVPVFRVPGGVAVNAVTNKVYFMNSSEVVVLDGATNTTTKVALPGSPSVLAVNSSTNRIYVTYTTASTSDDWLYKVAVIDGATNTLLATLPVGAASLAINAVTNKIYALGATAGSSLELSVIDGATNNVSTIAVGTGTRAGRASLAVNSVLNKAYAIVGDGVAVIDGSVASTTTTSTTVAPTTTTTAPVVIFHPPTIPAVCQTLRQLQNVFGGFFGPTFFNSFLTMFGCP